MEQDVRNLRFTTRRALDERILADALAALDQTRISRSHAARTGGWRKIMRKHWAPLTTIAAVIAIAVVSLTFFNRSAAPAYAIEQTLEANRFLRYVHVRTDSAGKGLAEAWAQFDEEGNLSRLRLEFPQTEDGPKTTVWQEGKAEVWFHAKNSSVIVSEPNIVARLPKLFEVFDPKLNFESLYQAEAAGRVQAEIVSPADPGEPLQVTVTASPSAEWREIYRIDPGTKRVLEFEKYRLMDGEYRLGARFQYDYEIDPEAQIFVLNPPPGVMRIDQTSQEIGVPRDGLTDSELAVKVAREFFQALIAGDYATAGRIAGGIPAVRLQESLGGVEYTRLIAVGDPFPHADPRTEFLCVPCEVEVRTGGTTEIKKLTLNIRHAYNQPDRWVVGGGI